MRHELERQAVHCTYVYFRRECRLPCDRVEWLHCNAARPLNAGHFCSMHLYDVFFTSGTSASTIPDKQAVLEMLPKVVTALQRLTA